MEKNIKEAIKKRGLYGAIQYCVRRLAGIPEIEEKIDSLHYFINKSLDIKAFPKAECELRDLQIADAILLAIVDQVCRAYDLDYWVNAGTMLGAYRHQGFIPWDDDVDIAMIRETYEIARPILKEELGRYGIIAEESAEDSFCRVGIGYHHEQTGIWVDLFPFEYTTVDADDSLEVERLTKKILNYRCTWRKECIMNNREKARQHLIEKIPEVCKKEKAKSIIDNPAFCSKARIFELDDYFPCKDCLFEGYTLKGPNKIQETLVKFYGTDFMSFPKTGVIHHNISCRAKEHNVDMKKEIEDLKRIYESIQKKYKEKQFD